jgi:dihydroxyacid dehydratase/phosphogluconate dehydratase
LLHVVSLKFKPNASPEQIAERMKSWTAPALKYTTGVFQKYVKLVGSAAQGAVLPQKATSFGPKPRVGLLFRTL